VLVDDLITKGVTEPYRMFTSRAEFRLQLREDNADMRLTEVGRRMGLVDDARWDAFSRKRDAVARETERLKATWVNPRNLRRRGRARAGQGHRARIQPVRPAAPPRRQLRSSSCRWMAASTPAGDVSRETLGDLSGPVVEQVEIAAKYSGYIDRQKDEVQRAAHLEKLRLPDDLDYLQVTALSIEARQKLQKHRPETLGQASRISGVTPAAISLLMVHLKKGGFQGFARADGEVPA
jgi:tRNA uridine 5-carboxymethylaminomethyl modification enzyme